MCHQTESQARASLEEDNRNASSKISLEELEPIETLGSFSPQMVVSGNLSICSGSHQSDEDGSSTVPAYLRQGARPKVPKISAEMRRVSSKARAIPKRHHHRYGSGAGGVHVRHRHDSGGGSSDGCGYFSGSSESSFQITGGSLRRRTARNNAPSQDVREPKSYTKEKLRPKGLSSDSILAISSSSSLMAGHTDHHHHYPNLAVSSIPSSDSLPILPSSDPPTTLPKSEVSAPKVLQAVHYPHHHHLHRHHHHQLLMKSESFQLSGSSSDVTSSSTTSLTEKVAAQRELRRRRASSEASTFSIENSVGKSSVPQAGLVNPNLVCTSVSVKYMIYYYIDLLFSTHSM